MDTRYNLRVYKPIKKVKAKSKPTRVTTPFTTEKLFERFEENMENLDDEHVGVQRKLRILKSVSLILHFSTCLCTSFQSLTKFASR